eukprot:TRINITY_DN63244_c0_g1_i1.p1 TRINITY_DN63244_c0_g1~~TRINITY_DN63244_c0_g1_i1.p1  ORF type:complete len:867 (+),score=191.12 TRINITY_DN63244_c0_g1_i1:146-2746(+)
MAPASCFRCLVPSDVGEQAAALSAELAYQFGGEEVLEVAGESDMSSELEDLLVTIWGDGAKREAAIRAVFEMLLDCQGIEAGSGEAGMFMTAIPAAVIESSLRGARVSALQRQTGVDIFVEEEIISGTEEQPVGIQGPLDSSVKAAVLLAEIVAKHEEQEVNAWASGMPAARWGRLTPPAGLPPPQGLEVNTESRPAWSAWSVPSEQESDPDVEAAEDEQEVVILPSPQMEYDLEDDIEEPWAEDADAWIEHSPEVEQSAEQPRDQRCEENAAAAGMEHDGPAEAAGKKRRRRGKRGGAAKAAGAADDSDVTPAGPEVVEEPHCGTAPGAASVSTEPQLSTSALAARALTSPLNRVPCRCLAPLDAARLLTGPAGATLQQIAAESGADIRMSDETDTPASLSDRVVSVHGDVAQQQIACRHIISRLHASQEVRIGQRGVFVMLVPSWASSSVDAHAKAVSSTAQARGHGAATADIEVEPDVISDTEEQPVRIMGTLDESVEATTRINSLLQLLVSEQDRRRSSYGRSSSKDATAPPSHRPPPAPDPGIKALRLAALTSPAPQHSIHAALPYLPPHIHPAHVPRIYDPLASHAPLLGAEAAYAAALHEQNRHAAAMASALAGGLPTALHHNLLGRPYPLPAADFGFMEASATAAATSAAAGSSLAPADVAAISGGLVPRGGAPTAPPMMPPPAAPPPHAATGLEAPVPLPQPLPSSNFLVNGRAVPTGTTGPLAPARGPASGAATSCDTSRKLDEAESLPVPTATEFAFLKALVSDADPREAHLSVLLPREDVRRMAANGQLHAIAKRSGSRLEPGAEKASADKDGTHPSAWATDVKQILTISGSRLTNSLAMLHLQECLVSGTGPA